MHRLHLSRHAAPAVVAIVAALLVPLFAGDAPVRGTAGSAVARAAVNDAAPAAPAPDARFAVGGEAMNTARALAEQHWGTAPCGGDVVIAWATLEESTNATAAWRNPTDAWNNAGENFDCHIEFNALSDYDWPKLCTVMTHEVGHLVGKPHSDAGGDLMSPVYSEPLASCTGPEPGAPAEAPAPAEAEPAADLDSIASTAVATKKRTVLKKTAAKKKKSAKRSKRCTRRFQAGRRSARTRCTKAQLRAARAARARR